jgi:hypothetical protein
MTGKPMSWTLEDLERELDRWEREMRAVTTVDGQHYSPHTNRHSHRPGRSSAGWLASGSRPAREGR